jgi:hypothetical protein
VRVRLSVVSFRSSGRDDQGLDAHQLQAQVPHLVQDAIEVRLVADLAYEGGLAVARFQAHSLERGPEPLGQTAPDADPVSGRLHVPSDAFGLASTLRAAPEAVIALGWFHPGELMRLKA